MTDTTLPENEYHAKKETVPLMFEVIAEKTGFPPFILLRNARQPVDSFYSSRIVARFYDEELARTCARLLSEEVPR